MEINKQDIERDQLDDARTEIQRLEDKVNDLEQSKIENFLQHKQILEAIEKNNLILQPIALTYATVGTLAKWFMALLIFLSVLGGVVVAWTQIFKK